METINSFFQNLFEGLLKQDLNLVHCRAIAKHLANVYLYGLSGKKALYAVTLEKANKFTELQRNLGKPILIVSTGRTAATQDSYWFQGRDEQGNVTDRSRVVTDARGLQSYHNYGLAFDIMFDGFIPTEADWEQAGKNGESLGLEWGGRWKDTSMGGDKPHFQWTNGGKITWNDLKSYFETGKI